MGFSFVTWIRCTVPDLNLVSYVYRVSSSPLAGGLLQLSIKNNLAGESFVFSASDSVFLVISEFVSTVGFWARMGVG